MRRIAAIVLMCLLCLFTVAQNWKQVHRQDEEKWAKATGLDSQLIHKMSRLASSYEEKDDPSRIANIDLDGLATHNHVLFVTYLGENNCLTITVLHRLGESKFDKLWSVESTPSGQKFCDTSFGTAEADAVDGAVLIRVPHTVSEGEVIYTQYRYEWNGITYRLAGQKEGKLQ